jgi:primosomal protein N' (replication factor Y)
MPILRVALDVPLNTLFDYLAPNGDVTDQDIGARVRVPFGKRIVTGVIMEVSDYSLIDLARLKQARMIFRDVQPLPKSLLDLFAFCAAYYHHPLGQVVMNGIPSRFRSGKPFQRPDRIRSCRLTETGRHIDISVIPARHAVKRRLLARLKEIDSITIHEARQLSDRAPAVLNEWDDMGWIEEVNLSDVETTRHSDIGFETEARSLTAAQKEAVEKIQARIGDFNTWLLHGVTGSGKTEVYLRLIAQMLRQGRQALVLVPEINLTPQLEAIFRNRFPAARLINLHSGITPSDRANAWLQAQQGNADIILGTRLAVFTPLPRLGLIVVDEEHDMSFKQQDNVRYSARDVAIYRAKQAGIPVILGSATPSLESYYNALSGRYILLRLPSRAVKDAALPEVRYIDTRVSKPEEGLSASLVAALEKSLENSQQSLVFINRRGYAPVLLCKSCAWAAACQRCASRLVVHLKENMLRCHHCGHQERIPGRCPECGDQDIAPFGQGTQRIEATLSRRIPDARILRIDRDSTRRRDAWPAMIREIREHRVDILIGTQILAKGHDFPNLSLVCVLNSDASLFTCDFRASERLFAQLIQVSGRAGRAGKAGEVLIQTDFPEHPLYRALQQHDYDSLAQAMLEERKLAGFPPYTYQALLGAEASRIHLALAFLADAAALAPASKQVEVFDPVPAQMARLKGMERACLLVQSRSRRKLQEFLGTWEPKLGGLPARKVRWALDVDPLEF